MDKMKLYNLLPVWAQNLACDYEGLKIRNLRFSQTFQKALKEYESHNCWSYEQMCDYRDAKLRNLIRHCYDTVPYYHKLFLEGGINPDSIKTVDDLKCLPVLTKSIIQKDPSQFISSKYPVSNLTEISTSGSTGASLILKVLPDNIAQQYAIWWRYRRRLGIDFELWHSEFGSRIIVPPVQKKPPFWRTSKTMRQVMFSAFHGNASTYMAYFEKLRKDKFCWIHATPSAFIPFASFCAENHLKLDHEIKFITTGAENLYDFQRKIIFDAFGVNPHTHYGLTEAVANFSEMPDGIMEVDEDFAAVEFLPEDDFFHITGTSLINYTMPLIRYDSGDIAFISGKIGQRGRIVDRIDGRNGDGIYLKNGTRIATLSALFSETKHIVEAQIHQLKDYSIVIQYVPMDENYAADLGMVEKMLNARIAGNLSITFERVQKIQRTGRGKLRYIISDVAAHTNQSLELKAIMYR